MLKIENLTKSYQASSQFMLSDINFQLADRQICAIVGQSGSGKSTLLRLIAGLDMANSGTISLAGKVLTSAQGFTPPENRNIGFVFQNFALFPHLTVQRNIEFGIFKESNKKEILRVLLDLVGLKKHIKKYPHELSGGEQQRVALARALAPNPSLLLLDEPFSNLDASIKTHIRNEVFDIIRFRKVSCIFVTHDTADAMTVADKIAILNDGKIVQEGTSKNLYENPRSAYVANFFGYMNVLKKADLTLFDIKLPEKPAYGIRPADVRYAFEPKEKYILAKVMKVIYMGSYYLVETQLKNDTKVCLETEDENVVGKKKIFISFSLEEVLYFEA